MHEEINARAIEKKARVMSLLETFQDRFPQRYFEYLIELVEVGEEELAVEDLCIELYERKCECSVEELRRLEVIATELGVSSRNGKNRALATSRDCQLGDFFGPWNSGCGSTH